MLRTPIISFGLPAFLLALLIATGAHAQSTTLKVGDAAPMIQVDKTIQGELPKDGQPYVLEFWATWCGPCKKSIPHLNDLHNRLQTKGMVILGISDESEDKVKRYVKQKGKGMSYPIAICKKDKGVQRSFFKAAGRKGIPSAFIVGADRRIKWIGNPLDPQFDKVVVAVTSGRYDPVLQRKADPKLEAARRAAKVRNFKQAYGHMDEVIALDNMVFIDVAMDKYRMMLDQEKNQEGANAFADTMIQMYSSKPQALQALGVFLASDPDLSQNDTGRARIVADMLISQKPRDVSSLSTSAAVAYHSGDFDRAVREQKMAWMYADPSAKPDLKASLDRYMASKRRGAAGR
jgi:thiol-disulfide isomerase/thioredoxin